MAERIKLNFDNVKITWKNFGGMKFTTNKNLVGDRSFGVILDEDTAMKLREKGYNVHDFVSNANNDSDNKKYVLVVKVRYDVIPPSIRLVTFPDGKKKISILTEETVGTLDDTIIEYADVVISAYAWEKPGRSGTTAYVSTMHVYPKQRELNKLDEEYYEYLKENEDASDEIY